MKKNGWFIAVLSMVVLVNVFVHHWFFRIDLTGDKRYSVSTSVRSLVANAGTIEVTLWLDGALNSGFLRLQQAVLELLDELDVYGDVRCRVVNPSELAQSQQQELVALLSDYGYHPTVIYERDKDGKAVQTMVWPYARIAVAGKETVVCLLQNNRGLSGAENLNRSVEALEYVFAEALHLLTRDERDKIAFLEGHGELPERSTADVQAALEPWFDVYRGSLTADAACLEPFRVVVIADPQEPFSEQDKYILDRYLMHGGRLLWLLNGVRFSEDALSGNGFTPVLPLDLNLQDMLFRYGLRVNPRLVADLQCLSVPVDVSGNPKQPQYQPMPWCYAPLLLTSESSPITRNVMQVSASFASDVEFVGDGEGQRREVLLATGNASRLIASPAEIDLADVQPDIQLFQYSFVPVAVSIEGQFPSLFVHRMIPEGIIEVEEKRSLSSPTRQVMVASGSVVRNEWQNNQPLPVGYDRYSGIQFGNRDFLLNTLLWLADDSGLIELRRKRIPLRMLNQQRTKEWRTYCTVVALGVPFLLLCLLAVGNVIMRKMKYSR